MPLSRRNFIAGAATLLPLTQAVSAMESLRKSNLGVQLYTVRNVILNNPAAILKQIQDIGYTEVEAIYATLDQIWPALKQTQLQAVSIHIDQKVLNGDQTDSAFGSLKQRGFQYVVAPSLPTNTGGADGVKRIAAMLDKAGAKAKASGLQLCYHNHAHDFQPIDGKPALQILLDETQKDLLALEMDVFWVSVAGHDPASLLKKYAGRVPLVHLKDKAKGVPVQYKEHVPAADFKEVGSGSVDMPAVLAAAASSGVKHYFVEQDQTPGDPIASLRKSYQYLSRHFKG